MAVEAPGLQRNSTPGTAGYMHLTGRDAKRAADLHRERGMACDRAEGPGHQPDRRTPSPAAGSEPLLLSGALPRRCCASRSGTLSAPIADALLGCAVRSCAL